MIKNFERLNQTLVNRARLYASGCKKVFVAGSGGVDSSLIIAILCEAFGSENVIVLYRNIKSNQKHEEHIRMLQEKFKFVLINLDANPIYDMFVSEMRDEFKRLNLPWADEGTKEAEELGFANAYASLKSRFNTPFAGFISKAVDNGNGRIFGTGNGEEDELLRYFDKYGDGAVDNNLLVGLKKSEVRQLALWKGVSEEIVFKVPSADLEGNGDDHNDEAQLTSWAKKLGYNINVSYGSPDGQQQGNVAWAWDQDIQHGLISNNGFRFSKGGLRSYLKCSEEQADTILFLKDIRKVTQHKVEPIPGVDRQELINYNLVE